MRTLLRRSRLALELPLVRPARLEDRPSPVPSSCLSAASERELGRFGAGDPDLAAADVLIGQHAQVATDADAQAARTRSHRLG